MVCDSKVSDYIVHVLVDLIRLKVADFDLADHLAGS